jgi:uncharacterized protein (TIGR03083 family)
VVLPISPAPGLIAEWHIANVGTASCVDSGRFNDCLAEDYALLRDAATSVDLDVPVPSCPGWMVDDLVYHVAEVYLHKATIMRTGAWPEPWPPPELAAEPRIALLGRSYGELTAQFEARDPAQATPTWYELDETVAFWLRRMAQETVIHRIDAELAAGLPSARVPDDLAIDGVDEVLTRFLAYFSPEEIADANVVHPADADGTTPIVVSSGGRSWTVFPSLSNEVAVEEGAVADPRVVVSAAPDQMLRWLWGRTGDDAVTVAGDPSWAVYLRRMLIATTQLPDPRNRRLSVAV